MYTPSARIAGFLALFLVFVVTGCSEDSSLVGPEASQKMSQTETLAIAPSNGVSAFSLGKGGKVDICHVPQGQDASSAQLISVGPNAADQHLTEHAGDGIPGEGSFLADCTFQEKTEYDEWFGLLADLEAAGRFYWSGYFSVSGCNGETLVFVVEGLGQYGMYGSNHSGNMTVYPVISSNPEWGPAVISQFLADNYTFCSDLTMAYNSGTYYVQYQDATVEEEGEFEDDEESGDEFVPMIPE